MSAVHKSMRYNARVHIKLTRTVNLFTSLMDGLVYCRFAALPTAQSTVFQLCDFSAPTLQTLLGQVQLQDTCSSKTGVQLMCVHSLSPLCLFANMTMLQLVQSRCCLSSAHLVSQSLCSTSLNSIVSSSHCNSAHCYCMIGERQHLASLLCWLPVLSVMLCHTEAFLKLQTVCMTHWLQGHAHRRLHEYH